jgi:poly-gamma-glutamate capsule biosynthesis protein CapA/YwtB (metallophosphatase superfamily)
MVTIQFTGDVYIGSVPGDPPVDFFFEGTREAIAKADLAVSHLESPPTSGPTTAAAGQTFEVLEAIARAGFDAVSMASNHSHDAGHVGIVETTERFRALGVVPFGVGVDIAAARAPAVLEHSGLQVGLLSYNCVGPMQSWATLASAGAAYVDVITHYRPDPLLTARMGDAAGAAAPPTVYTFATPESVAELRQDVATLRERVDVVAVVLHKGVVGEATVLDHYERPVSYAAVDAGADIVVSHHAHILRGVEVYKGRPIYHGLGNYASAFSFESSPDQAKYRAMRDQLGDFARRVFDRYLPPDGQADPPYSTFPYNPDSRFSMIGECRIDGEGVKWAGMVPCFFEPNGQNTAYGPDSERGEQILGYIRHITDKAGLGATLEWDGDRIAFLKPDATSRDRAGRQTA